MSSNLLSLYDEVVDTYKTTMSMKLTASITHVSYSAVRKIIITEGLYSSPLCDEINELFRTGISLEDIAKRLDRSRSCVAGYLPYTRGSYLTKSMTCNAIKLRKWRAKKKNSSLKEDA